MRSFPKKIWKAFLAGGIVLVSCAGLAQAASFQTGTMIVFPSAIAAKQETQISELKAAGVQVVRTAVGPLTGASAGKTQNSIDYIARLYAAGIKVDLLIDPQYPPAAPMRAKVAGFSGEYTGHPLSSADPQLSLAYYKAILQKLEAQHVVLAAIELGNELNGPSFNPEFPIPGEGRIYGVQDLTSGDAEARQIAKGFLQYIKICAALKQARDGSSLNQSTPIVSFGLAASGPVGKDVGTLDVVNPNEALKFLRQNGIDQYVDAYGVHFYGLKPHSGTVQAGLAVALSQCGVSGAKPCYISEWGLQNASTSCPVDDGDRAGIFQSVMQEYRKYNQEGRLIGALQFDWGAPVGSPTPDSWGVYRCGGLTQAGQAAFSQ